MKGPQFLQYINPILETLKEMGGAGIASEVIDDVIGRMKIPESEVEKTIASGQSRVKNRIQWAKMYLSKAGYIDSTTRGTWKLTEKGLGATLLEKEIYELFKVVHSTFAVKEEKQITKINEEEISTDEEEHTYN